MSDQAMKTILVTGAASGIGRATALHFAARGWRVVACDIDAAGLGRLAPELGAHGRVVIGDVRSLEGATAMVAAATQASGGTLDCLFNSAGVINMGPHHSIPVDRTNLLIDVNVKGVVHCIDAAYSALARTPGAHIVNMSSTSAEYGTPDHAVYSASKFFVRGLTEALNIEFEPAGINVSAVLVAYVRTPLVLDAPVQARTVERLGVKVSPEQVAETVWRAAHGRRVLWRVGVDAHLLNLVVRLLGTRSRAVYRRLMGY